MTTLPAFLHPFARPTRAGDQVRLDRRWSGAEVWDRDGQRYIDGMASLWYCNVGYGRVGDRRRRPRPDGERWPRSPASSPSPTSPPTSWPSCSPAWRRSPTAGCSSPAAARRRSTRPSSWPASPTSGPAGPSARVILSRARAYHGVTYGGHDRAGPARSTARASAPTSRAWSTCPPTTSRPGRATWPSTVTRWRPSSPSPCRARAASTRRPRASSPGCAGWPTSTAATSSSTRSSAASAASVGGGRPITTASRPTWPRSPRR